MAIIPPRVMVVTPKIYIDNQNNRPTMKEIRFNYNCSYGNMYKAKVAQPQLQRINKGHKNHSTQSYPFWRLERDYQSLGVERLYLNLLSFIKKNMVRVTNFWPLSAILLPLLQFFDFSIIFSEVWGCTHFSNIIATYWV